MISNFELGVIAGLVLIFCIATAALVLGSLAFHNAETNKTNLDDTITELGALTQMVFQTYNPPTSNGSSGSSVLQPKQNNAIKQPIKNSTIKNSTNSTIIPTVQQTHSSQTSTSQTNTSQPSSPIVQEQQASMVHSESFIEIMPNGNLTDILEVFPDQVNTQQVNTQQDQVNNAQDIPVQVIIFEEEKKEILTSAIMQNLNLGFFDTAGKNITDWPSHKTLDKREHKLFSTQKPLTPEQCKTMNLLPEDWAKVCVAVPLICAESGMYEFGAKTFVENKTDNPTHTIFAIIQRSQRASSTEFKDHVISLQRDVETGPHSLSESILSSGTYFSDAKELLYVCYASSQAGVFLQPANMVLTIQKIGAV
jgi:hypothetical protein